MKHLKGKEKKNQAERYLASGHNVYLFKPTMYYSTFLLIGKHQIKNKF